MNNLIYCHACGEQNPTTAKFCKGCGVKLEVAPTQDEPMVEANAQPEWSASQMAVSSPPTAAAMGDASAVGKRASAVSSQPDYTPSPYVAREYTALRSIAALCRTLSWIAVGLAALQGLGGLLLMSDSFFSGLAVLMLAALGGGLLYILLQVIAESISVMLDIEANTRRTANILEQQMK